MQKVAWPMMIVVSEKLMPRLLKNEFSAIPVMIPGSAIGSSSRNDTVSRPKKRKRWIANDAADPSSIATAVAASPTFTESHSELRTSPLCQATLNQCSVHPGIGHVCRGELLNA